MKKRKPKRVNTKALAAAKQISLAEEGPAGPWSNLSLQEVNFCECYVATGCNGTQAAIMAKYSEKTARNIASRLVRKVHIKAYIAHLMEQARENVGLTRSSWLKRLKTFAYTDMDDVMTFGPRGVTLKDHTTIPREKIGAIRKISETVTKDGGSIKVELADAQKALDTIGVACGWRVEQHEHTGKNGGPIPVAGLFANMPPSPETVEQWEAMVQALETAKTAIDITPGGNGNGNGGGEATK